MLIVDASCLFEVVAGSASAETVRQRMALDADQIAPHVVDVEVLGVVRKHRLLSTMSL
ncbi:MAG: hypothetical protein LH630_02045 [Actinomycetia bacterium]|nr:hypothetical protein [Actinomycetes bacterium]